MVKHLNVRVFGGVHGVSFRYNTQMKAKQLGIAGFVRNEPDGSVYVEAEGEERNLKEFLEWCKVGPRGAEVKKVNVEEKIIEGYKGFVIDS